MSGENRRSQTRAVQINRLTGYLDRLTPLLSMSVSTILKSGSAFGTVLSRLGLSRLRGPKSTQVLVRTPDFGPLAVAWLFAEVPGTANGCPN